MVLLPLAEAMKAIDAKRVEGALWRLLPLAGAMKALGAVGGLGDQSGCYPSQGR
ncbi:hypothetical protein KIK06_15120 [Nocardiopsis sp. EMB25]|uniref:hypothetical protein n=1 Tax=Nocardiopsis sp. EMB25 TaxID=2835867 RepID=UPI00228498BF|nr:hypothetical protein [Nocardiopsis sp. EMB25]MCY9785214.1 hypothetical protein [Nocardiopsis sp. EMB25]